MWKSQTLFINFCAVCLSFIHAESRIKNSDLIKNSTNNLNDSKKFFFFLLFSIAHFLKKKNQVIYLLGQLLHHAFKLTVFRHWNLQIEIEKENEIPSLNPSDRWEGG